MSIAQIPLRLTAGAFILNSGINKTQLSEEQAEQMRDMGANGVPFLKDLTPQQFKQFITVGEIGVGAALLLPFVPGWLAGTALTAFSTAMLSMYKNTEGMTQDDGIRPTEQGTAVAKDVWLFGMGTSLMIDGVVNRVGRKNAAASRRAKKLESAGESKAESIRAAGEAKSDAIAKAREEQTKALHDARKKLQDVRKSI